MLQSTEFIDVEDESWNTELVQEPTPLPDVVEAMKKHFGFSEFRPGQEDVILSVLSGRNTMAVMPTGAGKSLCYQLPATLLPGTTLVVSPLIALMQDQVAALEKRGIEATFINSTLSESARAQRIQSVREGKYRLVYVAPERFRSESFWSAIENLEINLLAIDEAHCISQWGHDFRPDYLLLGQARKRLRPPRTLALTATATPHVRDDIVRVLLMKEPETLVAGFDRPNLFLEVKKTANDVEKINTCLSLADLGSGVVYCSTRKQSEKIYSELKRAKVDAYLYHAGLSDKERSLAQENFMSRPSAVAIATNAFGMGIDKADIRFVAHAAIPKAIEAYYQEIGRAGRDGLPAHVVLLFNHADVMTQERLIELNSPSKVLLEDVWDALVDVGEDGIDDLARLARKTGARESEVSSAVKVLEREGWVQRRNWAMVASAQIGFSKLNINLELIEQQERQAKRLLQNMTSYAYATTCRRAYVLRYFGEAPRHGIKCGACDVCSGSLVMTPRKRPGGEAPARKVKLKRGASRADVHEVHDTFAFEEMKKWRTELAKSLSVPAFVIFSDATLREFARVLPRNRDEFLQVKGAGEIKWERFGPKVVELAGLARAVK